ncbi:hypothetical protein HBI12_242160 [Parastagonospora nodorum]|nr:hypothetical protein HBI12_242160 [Parastagonospora nodorum]
MLFPTSCATEKVHIYAADSLSSTITTYNRQLAEELATAESITAKDPNHVDTFNSDFAFSFANIQQSLLDKATVVPIIISVDKTQLLLILEDIRLTPSTLLAKFIPTTKIHNPLLKTLENAAKSRILLACADRQIKQCYLTICAILANYEEQVLLTSIKKNRYCTRYTKHHNFNIHVSLATDTLHLLLKGLVIKMLDFMQDILDDIYPSTVVSPLFISKAPFALHFIYAVYDLHALTHIIQDIRIYRALDSICTRANSEAYHITIVKQFYSITNKKEYILQICLHNSQRIALLAANYATVVKQRIQPHLTKLPLSKVAVNIAISNFTHAAAQSSSKRHNNSKHCNKEVIRCLHLILTIINYTCYDKDRKHIAYIRAFSKVLLFNNNRQINNTTRMLSMPFKFYDLSTIIRPVHLVLRDLPNSTTHEYNRLYSPTFNINLLRTLQEY